MRKGDERVIRGWNKAVNAGDYDRAASFFAPGAVVIQDFALPLPTHRIATEWNSGLPCRADITAVQGEGPTTVASFRLREGPPPVHAGGDAQVLFTIRGGLIRLWRQLPNTARAHPRSRLLAPGRGRHLWALPGEGAVLHAAAQSRCGRRPRLVAARFSLSGRRARPRTRAAPASPPPPPRRA